MKAILIYANGMNGVEPAFKKDWLHALACILYVAFIFRKIFEIREINSKKIVILAASFFSLILWDGTVGEAFSQTPVSKITATKGKEFWLGFMENYTGAYTKRLDVFVTSDKTTSGTLSIPAQSYSQSFNVIANQTTTINIPNNIAEHFSTETIDNKGIVILTLDTVSVYAINFEEYTADGTLVIPIGSLGTEYRVTSYVGLSGYSLYSEALIVATQDGTQVEIIPSTNTLGGKTAGTTYTINLNAGQTYQIKAALATTDLTGTVIRGSSQNGTCRPFAVFSGNICTNIPVGCTACDALFEQEYPTNIWGKNYMITPFRFASSYTYKVLADLNGTAFSINGGPSQNLNAGQAYEANNIAGPVYVTSNKRISVTQFMQGITCSLAGDPAQLILSPVDQVLCDITFSTVSSTVITQHNVNVIMKAAFISQLTLDGAPVNPASFVSFTPNPVYSYAPLSLTQGSHTLHADSGFIAYAYGTGSAESYAYALGSFTEETIIPTDTVYCTTTTIVLTPPQVILFPEWTTATYPDSVIGTGQSLTVTPTTNEIYIVSGISQLTGCPYMYKFSVEIPNPPVLTITQSQDTICRFDSIQLNVSVSPFSSNYLYSWNPSAGLSNPYIPNPVASPMQSTWYLCTVSTISGCGISTDSVFIAVRQGNISDTKLSADQTLFCLGDSAQLYLNIENLFFQDSIDPDYNPTLWSSVSGGVASNICGSATGNALYFNTAGSRFAATASLNVLNGGTIYFSLKIANGIAPCEAAETGEDVVLEYSINGGVSWVVFQTFNENSYPNFTSLSAAIPPVAKTTSSRFRWRQLSNSGVGQDNWALDNVFIGSINNSIYPFTWTPTTHLSDAGITNPMATPDTFITYFTTVIDTATGCTYSDSIIINVGQPFTLGVSIDDTVCQISGVPLFANPSIPGNYSFLWNPASTLSNNIISNPIATPVNTTTYYISVTSIQNCSATDSVKIFVPSISQFFSSPEADSICSGQSVQITTTYQKGCGANGSICSNPADTAQVGTALTTTSSNNGTLYNGTSLSSRFQLLFSKTELNAAGLSQGSTINEIGFRISSVAGSNIYQNFTIKMSCTGLSALSSSFVPNLVTVFNPKNVIISSNVVYYILDNTFDWDGSSNLIIEICYINSVTSANSSVYYSASTFNSFLATSSSSACNAASGILSMNRPNTYFKYCGAPPMSGLDFSWFPVSGLDNPNIPNPIATPLSPTIYYISASDSATGCIYTDSVRISVGPVFSLIAQDTLITCNTMGVQVSVLPSIAGNYSFNWTPAATLSNSNISDPVASPIATTQYNVSVTSESGCTIQDSVTVIVPALATFFATPEADTVCSGQQTQLNTFFQKGCGVNGSSCSTTPVSVQVGTSATTSSASNITIYKGLVNSSRTQILYRKTELNAAGISNASTLSSLGFNITSIAGSNIYQNFTIKMSCSSLTSLTTTFESGMQTVFNPKNIILSNGVNYYSFDMNFDWDGQSNILVEICYNNSVTSANSTISYSAVTFNAVNYATGVSVCGAVSGTTSVNRANTYFKYCSSGAGNGLSFQWSPIIGLSSDTIPNPIASPTSNTLYTVLATDTSTGCIFSDSVFIQTDSSKILSLGNDTSMCSGQSLTLDAGNGFQSYMWNDGSANSTKTVLSSGIYWVEVTSSCGTQRDSVQVIIGGNQINLDLGPDTVICSGSQIVLNVYDPTYYSYLWNDNSVDSAFTASSAGTYFVTVTNQCGTATDSVQVSVQNPVSVALGVDSVSCSGDSVLLNAGSSFTSYMWQDGSTGPTFVAFNTGIYFVSVTNACGNSSDTVMVSFTPLPSAGFINDSITICNGDSFFVFTNNCYECDFLWDDGGSDSSNYISSPGMHSVIVNNECGTAKDSLLAIIQAPVPVSLGNDTSLCFGNSVLLDAGNNFNSFFWQDGSTGQVFNVSNSGLFFVDATGACGSSTDTILVNFFSNPSANISNDTLIICNGDTATVFTNSCFGCTFQWDNGSTDSLTSFFTQGFHQVVVTNQCGIASDSVLILVQISAAPDLGNDVTKCSGDTVTLDAGNGYFNYLWQDGSSLQTFLVVATGTYYVTMNNSCGFFSDTINAFFNEMPTIELGNDTDICEGDSILLSISDCAGCNFFWQDGSSGTSFLVTSDGSYFVNVSNQCGSGSDVINIFNNPVPSVFLGNDTAFCGSGSTIVLNAFFPSSSYLWSNGSNSSSLTVTSGGTYWVQVSNDCGTGGDSMVISITALPAVDFGIDTLMCDGTPILLNATGSSVTQYHWQDSSGNSTFLATEGGLYWVEVSNSCGNASDSILITEESSPVIELGNDVSFCNGDHDTIFGGNNNYQYFWNDGSSGSFISVNSAGTYWVMATNNCGTASDSINVSVNTLPVVELGNDTLLCISDTINLDVSQTGCTYLWQNNTTIPKFSVVSGGTFWVVVSDSNGCQSSDTIIVSAGSKPLVSLGSDTAICPGDEVLLDVSSLNYNYEWQDGSTNSFYLAKDSGWYFVIAKNYCGSNSDSMHIGEIDCNCHVDVPTAFSPNGDGANDILYLRGNCVIGISFFVYDRWGQLVFESHDLSNGWDGTFKGKKMDTAVFVYYLSARSFFNSESEFVKKGNISLLR